MKKYLAGLIAAFMLAAGLVTVSGELAGATPAAATRACKPTKYVQCPATKTSASPSSKSIKKGKTATVAVTVKAPGNVKPKGTVTITIKGPGVNKTIKVAYNGKSVKYTTPKLKKKGTYTVTIKFSGTNAKDSTTKATIKVK